jgi:adenosylcobinamide kinase/adenosylcobinamide-phosphate guanylyltransferase
VVVIDCLTLWLSNWMLKHPRLVDAKIQELTEAAAGTDADVIAVTNEVGSSIVPDSALGRSFRDAAGRMNQTFARLADSVYLMVCGIPLQVK